MTTDPIYRRLLETSWRRQLTNAEEAELRAWLAAHPEATADWEVEVEINQALGALPDLPVPSNFTARVLAGAERERAGSARSTATLSIWKALSRWLPGAAVAGVVLGVGGIAYVHNSNRNESREMARIAQSVETVSEVRSLPSPRILQDFEAIQALKPAAAKPDVVLLSLLE